MCFLSSFGLVEDRRHSLVLFEALDDLALRRAERLSTSGNFEVRS